MSKKYFIDLDNTLCFTNGNDYNSSKPIEERIRYVNKLKDEGNTITIWTARGSTTGINLHMTFILMINHLMWIHFGLFLS